MHRDTNSKRVAASLELITFKNLVQNHGIRKRTAETSCFLQKSPGIRWLKLHLNIIF